METHHWDHKFSGCPNTMPLQEFCSWFTRYNAKLDMKYVGKYDSQVAFTKLQQFLADEDFLTYKQHQAKLMATTTTENPAHLLAIVKISQTTFAQALATHQQEVATYTSNQMLPNPGLPPSIAPFFASQMVVATQGTPKTLIVQAVSGNPIKAIFAILELEFLVKKSVKLKELTNFLYKKDKMLKMMYCQIKMLMKETQVSLIARPSRLTIAHCMIA